MSQVAQSVVIPVGQDEGFVLDAAPGNEESR